MKKVNSFVFVFCIVAGFILSKQFLSFAYASEDAELKVSDGQGSIIAETGSGEEDDVIVFEDKNLEAAIRKEINKPEGDIFISDVRYVKELILYNNQISDITPLSNFVNLEVLYLTKNLLSDISPLSNLTNLTTLSLSRNQISDIAPLSNLTSLNFLFLLDNQINDISPLANLTNLASLSLSENQIRDIDALGNLSKLLTLELAYNQIYNITSLANLEYLFFLDLTGNPIYNSSTPNAVHKAELDFVVGEAKYEVWVVDILLGDVDGNGNVNSIDFGHMRKYLLGITKEFPSGKEGLAAADIDNNGSVNSIDFGYLRNYFLGKGTMLPI